jgi:hypothetical protein
MSARRHTRFDFAAARVAAAASLLAVSASAFSAATIVIVNGNAPGVGFNDPTPVAPVGGNTGTTLGQQRLNAFQAAANIWGATLTSVPAINVLATFEPLSCTATSAVLGSAGPTEIFSDFPGAPLAGTWYHYALTNKLYGATADPPNPEIRARFNSNLGNPGCLTGTPFYLGLDNNHGGAIDLVTVLLHEFGHGLGFSTVTSGSTGAQILGQPSAYDWFAFDNTAGKNWVQMTDAERQASAVNPRKLVWTGGNVTAAVPSVLQAGTPLLSVSGSVAVAGNYDVGTASFGPPLANPGVTADIMPLVDTTAPTGATLACDPIGALAALSIRNNIALVDRGVCGFVVKVKNAQNAGAKAVIVADNAAGGPPAGLGGSDPTITIPSVRITQADGNLLKGALKFRSRTRSGVIGTLGLNPSIRAGADALGRALLFTPNPFQSGSSVSHWDTIATPNQLMEPAINGDLTHSVIPPQDLTFRLLQDLGW